MSIYELPNSREYSSGQIRIHYEVDGTANDSTVKASVLAEAPATWDDYVRDDESLTVTPVPQLIDSANGVGTWIATIAYKPRSKVFSEVGTVRISGSTTGGSQHITQSLETVSRYPAGGTAPDFKGAIGVTESGVDGVDIGAKVFNFSVVKVFDPAVSIPLLATLYNLTYTYNNAEFTVTDSVTGLTITFAECECLFTGIDLPFPRDDGKIEITFHFEASPNKTNLTVGDMTGITKAGHNYLWAYYQQTEDATAKKLVRRPVAAIVDRVYDAGNFSGLDLGLPEEE